MAFTAKTPRFHESPSNRTPVSSLIDSTLSSISEPDAPGLALLVRKDDSTIFERGYGLRDLHTRTKIDPATNFRLASCTKQFTAVATMLLIRDRALTYDTRLTDVLPDFPAYGKSIVIRNLLNHTSGLPDYEDSMPQPQPNTAPDEQPQISDAGVLTLLELATTKFQPGTRWAYSNSGYVLLGHIIARVSHKPLPQFLHDRIFSPLGMSDTIAYVKGRNEVPNRAYGHSKKGNAWIETDQDATSATLGDGGVYSSLNDLAKWDDALTHHTLLSEEEMQPALSPVNVPNGGPIGPNNEPAAYGFGWFLNPYNGHPRMWHHGETVGFRASIQRFTHDRLTVIVLCNRSDLRPSALGEHIADFFFTPKNHARPGQ